MVSRISKLGNVSLTCFLYKENPVLDAGMVFYLFSYQKGMHSYKK